MNRGLFFIIIILMLGATMTLAEVSKTKHNFSSQTYSPNAYFLGARGVCVFCHTAHNSDTDAPLWNHAPSGETYDMYGVGSPTMDMSRTAQPNKGSLVCLSCHDGTIAVNSLNNLPGSESAGTFGTPGGSNLDGAGKILSTSHAYVGTDLKNDHPVGIIYNASQDPTGFEAKTGNPLAYPDTLLSEGLYVECNSCHDPHDNTYGNFLIISNNNSALCLKCHTK